MCTNIHTFIHIVVLFCRIYSTFSERKCGVLLSLASDRMNRMREVVFTRPYVGRKSATVNAT